MLETERLALRDLALGLDSRGGLPYWPGWGLAAPAAAGVQAAMRMPAIARLERPEVTLATLAREPWPSPRRWLFEETVNIVYLLVCLGSRLRTNSSVDGGDCRSAATW